MKPLQSTLILLLIVGALGAYIWFNERGPIAESGATVLLRTDPNTVNRVVMDWNGSRVELQKSGAQWMAHQTKSDIKVPADADAVKTLLNDLQLVQSPSILPDDAAKRKSYGLEKPASFLEVAGTKIEFGTSPSFDATKVYARVTGDGKTQVALVPATLSSAVAKSFEEWRDKVALRVTLEEAQKFTIKAPAVSATLEKTKAAEEGQPGEWKVSVPVSAEADASTIESFLGQLPTTNVTRWIEDNPKSLANWGLDKPQVQLEITTPDGPRSLLIGKKLNAGYAAKNSLSPAVFEVPDTLFSMINRPLRDWRSRTVVKLDVDKAQKVEITARGGTKTFNKDNDKWREVGAKTGTTAKETEAADATHRAVMDVLFAVQALNATDFVDKPQAPAVYGFDKPVLDFKVDGNTRVQISSVGGKAYARTSSNSDLAGSIFVLSPSVLDGFTSPLNTLFGAKK